MEGEKKKGCKQFHYLPVLHAVCLFARLVVCIVFGTLFVEPFIILKRGCLPFRGYGLCIIETYVYIGVGYCPLFRSSTVYSHKRNKRYVAISHPESVGLKLVTESPP